MRFLRRYLIATRLIAASLLAGCALLVATPRIVTDRIVAPSGSGTTCSAGSPCTVLQALSVSVAGDTVSMQDGTYTGANGMVRPVSSGTSDSTRILIRAINEGNVTVDGQFARIPMDLNGVSWIRVRGINFKSSSSNVGTLRNGATNNIIERSIFWDAPMDANVATVEHDLADDNLWEDIAVFGAGRFSFENYRGYRNTCRRCWIRWEGSINVGPKRGLSWAYGGAPSGNFTCENCLTTWWPLSMPQVYTLYHNGSVWGGDGAGTYSNYTIQSNVGPMGTEGNVGESLNTTISGSLSYIRATDYIAGAAGASPNIMVNAFFSNNQTIRQTMVMIPPTHPNAGAIQGFYMGDPPTTTSGNLAQNITSVLSYVNTFNTGWSVAQHSSGSTIGAVASPWTATNPGANLCKQWVGGSVTTTPLWPWPMNDRIKAATNTAGAYSGPCGSGGTACSGGRAARTLTDVTADIQALLGTIPTGCRTATTTPNPPAGLTLTQLWRSIWTPLAGLRS